MEKLPENMALDGEKMKEFKQLVKSYKAKAKAKLKLPHIVLRYFHIIFPSLVAKQLFGYNYVNWHSSYFLSLSLNYEVGLLATNIYVRESVRTPKSWTVFARKKKIMGRS